ncbi:LysM peptidoglycan-binding domain-containing protein [Pseudarthrobacter sulfonivorans]|uniref:LysM peptidoglycan-binding domain-containing protein n=1 Tax=Pseudarthrobacter sulfonivorans TaxID=121292 RepID=UPI0021056CC5|nr:LysM peptidoglycan-binding domain-containing protein [Pseudarthrobacter sulfonivorans]
MAVSILLLGSFLCLAGAGLMDRWHFSAARRQAAGFDDLLGAVAVAAGLAIVAWWIFAVVASLAVAVLVRCGRRRAADRAGRLCPSFMLRLAVAALSAQLLAAPMAEAAAPPAGPAWSPTQGATVQAQWAPTVNAQPAPEPAYAPPEPPVAAAAAPVTEPHSGLEAVGPDWRPSPPVTDPGLLSARPVRAAQGSPPSAFEVTVLAGDTLWDIALRQLGPTASDVDVALQWPRWYEANKAQIGENPNVLLPGQILKAPATA